MIMVIYEVSGALQVLEGIRPRVGLSPGLVGDKAKDGIRLNLKVRMWVHSPSITQGYLLSEFGLHAWHRDVSVTITE